MLNVLRELFCTGRLYRERMRREHFFFVEALTVGSAVGGSGRTSYRIAVVWLISLSCCGISASGYGQHFGSTSGSVSINSSSVSFMTVSGVGYRLLSSIQLSSRSMQY